MRRRPRPRDAGVPEELCRFVAAEWPDARCPHEAVRQWQAACLAWVRGGPGRALPFGTYGDEIDALRESGRYRQAMPPCPHEYRPAQHWTNGAP